MLTEITNLQGLEVITEKGISLGIIEDSVVNMDDGEIYELLITETNEEMVEDGVNVGVPFRWVQSVSKVVLLKYFPGKIKRKDQMDIPAMPADGRKRKLRVVRKNSGDLGVDRMGWR